MSKIIISIFFLLQLITIYLFEISFFFKLNLLIIPFGIFIFSQFYLDPKMHFLTKLLLVFLCYTSLQTVLTSSADLMIRHLFSDESGLITYLSLGLVFSLGINKFFNRNHNNDFIRSRTINNFVLYLLIFFNISFILSIFSIEALLNDLVSIRFSMEESTSDYQVIGDSYILIYFIVTIILVNLFHSFYGETKQLPNLRKILLIIFFLSGVLASQIIGSNKATAIIFGFGVIFISLIDSIKLNKETNSKFFSNLALFSIYKIATTSFTAFIFMGFMIFILDLEEAFKLLNYDEASLLTTSITSRIDIFSNFFTTWNVSPIFGSMQADYLIFEPGKFAHSLPLSLLSHSGLIGFVLFTYFTFKLFSKYFYKIDSNVIPTLIERFMVLSVFIFSVFATFWGWSIVWFSIGYIFGRINNTN